MELIDRFYEFLNRLNPVRAYQEYKGRRDEARQRVADRLREHIGDKVEFAYLDPNLLRLMDEGFEESR